MKNACKSNDFGVVGVAAAAKRKCAKTPEKYKKSCKTRANQKKKEMIQAINSNLGGIVSYRFSPYKGLGKDEDCRLYVYKDSKSRTQWGFGHKEFYDNNVIVYHMKNMKLLKEK